MSGRRISVIGMGTSAADSVIEQRLNDAVLLVGGTRLLATESQRSARQVELNGDLSTAFAAIDQADGDVVVLASGDPGFFGIVRRLADHFGSDGLDVFPASSSVSAAFAAVGLPWEDARVVSAHGRDPSTALNVARAHHKVAIFTSPDCSPQLLAGQLTDEPVELVVVEQLGTPALAITRGVPSEIATTEFSDPNVLLVLADNNLIAEKSELSPPRGPSRWALPDDQFDHREGMITKSEVRAFVLSRLGPGYGDMVWDVGAGSGSVAVECARHGAAVVAIEKDPNDVERIVANAQRHRVRVRSVAGIAPDVLDGLPVPDAVFIGGGGTDLENILSVAVASARRAVVVNLAAVERVVPAQAQLEAAGFAVEVTLLQASRLQPLADAHRFAAENPVFVVSGVRRATGRSES